MNLPNLSDTLLLDDVGGGDGNGSDGDGENGEDMSEPEHDSDSEEDTFEYDWCEAEPNIFSPELPEFQKSTGPSDEAKMPRHHLSVSSLRIFTNVLGTMLATQYELIFRAIWPLLGSQDTV